MILYDYYRSTACYRVRLALQLKQCTYETVVVQLVENEHHTPEYHQLNPQELVPSLVINGQVFSQSLAIIDYLEETYPDHPLLPTDPFIKAELRSIALNIACDMHPLNNLRVLNRIRSQFQATEAQVTEWYHHWLKSGFDGIEAKLATLKRSKPVCYGATPTLADICLIPQVFNAHRFEFAMNNYPLINEINTYCTSLPAFKAAAP